MELNVSPPAPSIERLEKRRRLVPSLPRRAVFVSGLLLAALVSLLYLSQASDLAGTGYDIADLQTQQQQLQMENEQLQLQVAQLESLDRVDKEASTRLHMGPPSHVIYVSAPPLVIPTPATKKREIEGNGALSTTGWLSDVLAWLRDRVP